MTTAESRFQALHLAPGLTVDDLDASLDFYLKLGFAVEERWEDEGELRGGSCSGPARPGSASPRTTGPRGATG